jgi:hypothetical protein
MFDNVLGQHQIELLIQYVGTGELGYVGIVTYNLLDSAVPQEIHKESLTASIVQHTALLAQAMALQAAEMMAEYGTCPVVEDPLAVRISLIKWGKLQSFQAVK